MRSGHWVGWIAVVITAVSGIASIGLSPLLLFSDLGLILAAIAASKKCFVTASITYGLWFVFHFPIHRYHLALLDTANHAHNLVVIEFVFVNAVFVLGLLVGVVSSNRHSSSQDIV